jgi:NAD(P)-dependent dehydrogenase (short-subunit alcohol dehydrogenase family)
MGRALADAGHSVFASMRDVGGRNHVRAEIVREYAQTRGLDFQPLELDVSDEASIAAAVEEILRQKGKIDVLIHNAGHMTFGPTEAFLPEQLAELYDVNVVGTQRVNRAVLPHMRTRRSGLVVWVSSSSTRGGTPPYLGPYFAAKAAMDSLAVSYAAELIRWGIETSIIVPGVFTSGTNHFQNAGAPRDPGRSREYSSGPYRGIEDQIQEGLRSMVPPQVDAALVAQAVVKVLAAPQGTRPFRVHVDPANDGAEAVSEVADTIRLEFLKRLGLEDLTVLSAS